MRSRTNRVEQWLFNNRFRSEFDTDQPLSPELMERVRLEGWNPYLLGQLLEDLGYFVVVHYEREGEKLYLSVNADLVRQAPHLGTKITSFINGTIFPFMRKEISEAEFRAAKTTFFASVEENPPPSRENTPTYSARWQEVR